MTLQDSMKCFLKNIKPFYEVNAFCKALMTVRRYHFLRSYYEKEATKRKLVHSEDCIGRLLKKRLEEDRISVKPLRRGELRSFWVGTNYAQDSNGILQALEKFGETILFEGRLGEYGQIWPVGPDLQIARSENSRSLLAQVNKALRSGPVHILMGQMWNMCIAPEALNEVRKMGIMVVNIAMDDRHVFKQRKLNGNWTGPFGLIESLHLACTAAKECCLWYFVEGCPALYLPEASDPDIYRPSPGPKRYEVSFVGGNYGIRSAIIRALQREGIRVTTYGNGWPNGRIATQDMALLFAHSRIVLGVGTIRTTKDFYALKMRDFDGPMSGSLYITHHNPDLEKLYDIGKEIITYHNIPDCVQKVKYYLANPDVARNIGRAGRLRAKAEHTWEKRFEKLFSTLGIISE
jgi:spore maturation protein CgeB